MSEHKLPREVVHPGGPEVFLVFDAAVGKKFAMRELNDEQLEKHIKAANEASKAAMTQGLALIGQSQQAGRAASCLEYERDRRSRRLISILQ